MLSQYVTKMEQIRLIIICLLAAKYKLEIHPQKGMGIGI